jgi:hypothetical protein
MRVEGHMKFLKRAALKKKRKGSGHLKKYLDIVIGSVSLNKGQERPPGGNLINWW